MGTQADAEQINTFYGDITNKYSCCNTMQEMVHHCLRCNSFAYEVEPGHYKCSKCEFSWEVI